MLLYRIYGDVGFKWTCSEADQSCSCFRVNGTNKDCSVFSMHVFVGNTEDDDGDDMGTHGDINDTGDDGTDLNDTGYQHTGYTQSTGYQHTGYTQSTGYQHTGYTQSTGNLTVSCKLGNRVKIQKTMEICMFSIAEIAIIGASTGTVFFFLHAIGCTSSID